MADITISTSPNGDVVLTVRSSDPPPWAATLLSTMEAILSQQGNDDMALSKSVQDLVNQVSASKSLESSSAAALTELKNQAAQLSAQIVDLTATAGGMSAEDAAAIAQAAKDLADSATALQTAVPANTPPPVAPPVVIPPATPPVV